MPGIAFPSPRGAWCAAQGSLSAGRNSDTANTAGTVAGYFSDWESGLTVFSTIVSICTIEHRN